MDAETLIRANRLAKMIEACNRAKECFFYEDEDSGYKEISLKPSLIVEHIDTEEWDRRTTTPIPIELDNELIKLIQQHIEKKQIELEIEFKNL